jgi:mannose/cellobiose epimerase-like protein (N-acyl-D-glucosamine 2-epimerase family)
LLQRTGEKKYEDWYRLFWEFNERYFIDYLHGSWRHELNPQNEPSADIWPGKPDLYHAYQATLLPLLALAPSLATGLARLG